MGRREPFGRVFEHPCMDTGFFLRDLSKCFFGPPKKHLSWSLLGALFGVLLELLGRLGEEMISHARYSVQVNGARIASYGACSLALDI